MSRGISKPRELARFTYKYVQESKVRGWKGERSCSRILSTLIPPWEKQGSQESDRGYIYSISTKEYRQPGSLSGALPCWRRDQRRRLGALLSKGNRKIESKPFESKNWNFPYKIILHWLQKECTGKRQRIRRVYLCFGGIREQRCPTSVASYDSGGTTTFPDIQSSFLRTAQIPATSSLRE